MDSEWGGTATVGLQRQTDMILDVGMNNGDDTEFYLAKGFRVVAVEANPMLVERAKARFASAIQSGRLVIHGVAVTSFDGTVDFYEDLTDHGWSTLLPERAKANEALGSVCRRIEVPARRLEGILAECGVPYYMKVDIQGLDRSCLEALKEIADRPRYVSWELDLVDFEDTFLSLRLLWDMGYRKYKIVNQVTQHTVRLPQPPREGSFVDFHFKKGMSGAFGEEAPGQWMDLEATFEKYFWLRKRDAAFIRCMSQGKVAGIPVQSIFPLLRAIYNWRPVSLLIDAAYRIRGHRPSGWYDIHAKGAGAEN